MLQDDQNDLQVGMNMENLLIMALHIEEHQNNLFVQNILDIYHHEHLHFSVIPEIRNFI